MVKRIMITGAAGFIGSCLADSVLHAGFQTFGIDNFDPFYDRYIKENNIKEALKNSLYRFREGDIRDAVFMDKCFSEFNPEIVVHLAAKAGVSPSLLDPKIYFDVNVTGTLNLLEMMKKHNTRKLIFASSSSVYGNNQRVPFSESDNVDFPISPYAATKKTGELLCYTFHHLYKLDIFCLRFFTVYGPRQRPDLAICKFTKSIINGERISLYGDGLTSRDYTHIDDIIQGIRRAVEKVRGFEIFNLGESKTINLKDLVMILEKYIGRQAKLDFLPMREGDVIKTYADITKARKVLDYLPEVDIESGIRNYVEWFKKQYS